MSRPLRILHFVHRLGDGGADHALTRLVNGSDPAAYRHIVLTLEAGPGHAPLRPDVITMALPEGRVARALGALAARYGGRIDLVHGWVSSASIVAAGMAASLGAPLVLRQPTNMDGELRWEGGQAARYWPQLRRAFEVADAVVVPSPASVESTRRICGVTRPVVIPNAVDVEGIAPWRRRARAGRPFTLGFVGRLCRQKDPLTLVDALGRIGTGIDWRLVVFGDGYLRAEMAARALALGIEGRIECAGFRPAWHARANDLDAFVLPTRFEGMSNALLEAAAVGLPIVMTSIPENLAVVTPGDQALAVPPGDPASLAAAIMWLAAHPALAAGLGRRARVAARRFTVDAMVGAHEALYRSLAGTAAARAA